MVAAWVGGADEMVASSPTESVSSAALVRVVSKPNSVQQTSTEMIKM